ncbi:unnamed protein product [Miscanthus lutarioriparius]|uniref:Uncharacterized protein n=1 Tax=Miscanthus lutarioriparius TaxID=422564 RepID=A0A811QQB3_9POAL|nr:unnamed protein product [Miscanthus lutarioriparius]
MAASPVPVLCSASPCRVAIHLTPPAFRTIAAARPQALPLGFCVERGGPSPRARAPFAAKRGGSRGSCGRHARAAPGGTLGRRSCLYTLALPPALRPDNSGRKQPVTSIAIVQGDPILAISQATISDLIGLSLNFFVLPLLNSAFLIPYMAIRLNDPDADQSPPQRSQLGSVMVNGAPVVGAIGGLVCVLSIVWAFFGRGDAEFGGTAERWQYVQSYVLSDRLAYAFLWDIFLYSIFQPWLIGDNLQNVKADATEFVNAYAVE